jgi:hypothetical protein
MRIGRVTMLGLSSHVIMCRVHHEYWAGPRAE